MDFERLFFGRRYYCSWLAYSGSINLRAKCDYLLTLLLVLGMGCYAAAASEPIVSYVSGAPVLATSFRASTWSPSLL